MQSTTTQEEYLIEGHNVPETRMILSEDYARLFAGNHPYAMARHEA